jgi:uncharacterized membrane protein (GlpM family)
VDIDAMICQSTVHFCMYCLPLYFRVLHSICLGRCMIGLHETLLSEIVRLGWPAVVFVIPWPRGSDLCHSNFLVE